MTEFDDLRIFERVAVLHSFARASRELSLPHSSVSRAVQRLERRVGIRLLQRTTRRVELTEAGTALLKGSQPHLAGLSDALTSIGEFADHACGTLKISTGIAFGINILPGLLPAFLQAHPEIDAVLDLTSTPTDLVAEQVDVAIRMGALPDSPIIARRLGVLPRYLCASPDYLALRGTPEQIGDLAGHDLVDLPIRDGRRSVWRFERDGEVVEHRQRARLSVNCALTIHNLLVRGAGIGLSTAYMCAPEIEAGRLVRVLSGWSAPAVPVHAVFPSQRQMAPAVRAFVDFMIKQSTLGPHWQADLLQNPVE